MKRIYNRWTLDEVIPVTQFLKRKKIKKYFNRETAAAVTTLGMLLAEYPEISCTIPVCYATGDLAYQDYGLEKIVAGSIDDHNQFQTALFIEKGISEISPLNQFKILQNMPLCFSAIEFNLTGENSVVYNDSVGMRIFAGQSNEPSILLGAGKVHQDGTVESVFMVCDTDAVARMNGLVPDDAIEFICTLEEV